MKQRRHSIQRDAILEALKNTKEHPTADAVYEEVRKVIPNVSKGTVYRNLKVLQEAGKVAELRLDDTASRYDYRREHHPHFRCDACGRVIDVDGSIDAGLDRLVEEATGLKIDCHQLEFRGVCLECQKPRG